MDSRTLAMFYIFTILSLNIVNTWEKSPRLSSLPLYNGVKSWCRSVEIQHSVQEPGCETKVIENRACMGQCFSYYAPGTHPRKDLSDKRMKYCDMCKPSLKSWTKVSLDCPGTNHGQVDKLVEIIYSCTCQKCIKDLKQGWWAKALTQLSPPCSQGFPLTSSAESQRRGPENEIAFSQPFCSVFFQIRE